MIIFPAIDIKGGKCVRLLKGDFNKITQYEKSPFDQANEFSNLGFNNIHLVDLDGALTENPVNENIIKEIGKINKAEFSNIMTKRKAYLVTILRIYKTIF